MVKKCIKIMEYKFEGVHRLAYLGSPFNDKNDMKEELSRQIQMQISVVMGKNDTLNHDC
jgi:hypothetical protein